METYSAKEPFLTQSSGFPDLYQPRKPSFWHISYLPFLQKFLELYPGQVQAAAVYGSATGVNYLPGRSDINSVIILDRAGFGHPDRSLALIARAGKRRIAPPLLLTEDFVLASLDVFPVEFLDIKENHVLVYGEDLFSQWRIDGVNLRLFCEHQIKGKLVSIRQAYLANGLKSSAVAALLPGSLNSLFPIFRNLLRLKGRPVEFDKTKLLAALCAAFGLDEQVFRSVYACRSERRLALKTGRELMEQYLRQIEKLAEAVDKI